MSILDRRFPDGTVGDLCASYATDATVQSVKLTETWFVIARQKVIQKLEDDRPVSKAQLISIESIVETYEGKTGVRGQKFNSLVGRLLDIDFYNSWIIDEA